MFLKMVREEVTTDIASSRAHSEGKEGRREGSCPKGEGEPRKFPPSLCREEGVVNASNVTAEMTRRMNSLHLVMRISWLIL